MKKILFSLIFVLLLSHVLADCSDYKDDCIGCALAKVNGSFSCFYCVPEGSDFGCYPIEEQGKICLGDEDGNFVHSNVDTCASNPCSQYDGVGCNACLKDPRCGLCMTTGICQMGDEKGALKGECEDWRFKLTDTCSPFYPCSQQKDCDSCLITSQDKGVNCQWCGDSVSGSCQASTELCATNIQTTCEKKIITLERSLETSAASTFSFCLALLFLSFYCMF
eukprot:TRINITY_DN1384_c0_g1_i1.p1 TRINITY_DN1384_c0_g1~~TRINITY_DN1384_c0_g1_i1.p1  ORF type:complete len:230 (+),score=68.09 TRINITY_DN1384_c0_g1_i1:27-692(+)